MNESTASDMDYSDIYRYKQREMSNGSKAIGIKNFYISTLDFLDYLLYNIIE